MRDLFQEVRHEFGDVIISQGEPADAFFVLVTGRARVLKTGKNGEEIPLNRLMPGDEFGEAGLLASDVRNATVRCSTTVELLRLEQSDFLPLLDEFPELRQSLEEMANWRALHGFLYVSANLAGSRCPRFTPW